MTKNRRILQHLLGFMLMAQLSLCAAPLISQSAPNAQQAFLRRLSEPLSNGRITLSATIPVTSPLARSLNPAVFLVSVIGYGLYAFLYLYLMFTTDLGIFVFIRPLVVKTFILYKLWGYYHEVKLYHEG